MDGEKRETLIKEVFKRRRERERERKERPFLAEHK